MSAARNWPLDAPPRADLIAFVETLADAARPIALRGFRASGKVDFKSDGSPVTASDRQVEEALRDLIRERFPDHSILGEEFGSSGRSGARWGWSLDPIDGTRAFVTGRPLFGTLIAFLESTRPILGVIEMPALAERYVGVIGEPTLCNGEPCRVSDCTHIEEARVSATSPDMFESDDLVQYDEVSFAARMRGFGGDCYQYALLASGYLDIVMEAGLAPYDLLALVPVIEGAGGVITDWQGGALTARSGGQVIASATQELHGAALALIEDAAF